MGKRSPESTFSFEYISDKVFVHNTISSFVSSLISKHPYPYFNLNTITSAADILSVDSYMSIYAWSGSSRIRTYSALRQQIYSLSRLSNCGADLLFFNLNERYFFRNPRPSTSTLENPFDPVRGIEPRIVLIARLIAVYFIIGPT